jgi:hypothetical protein
LGATTGSQVAQFAEYDPSLNVIALLGTGPANFTTQQASPLLLLPNGHALLVLWDRSWYDIQFSGKTMAAPTITSFPSTVARGTTVTLGGKQLCGLSEVSMMGDDNQQAENYPLVRVTGAGVTRYLRAHDVSTRSIAPNVSATVSVDIPSNLSPGAYTLQVVAMGVGSAPLSIQVR